MKFSERETTRKGKLGEIFAREYFATRPVTIYEPSAGPHPCDFILYSHQGKNAGRFTFVDVKTCPRRYVRAQNGIDLDDWIKYQQLSEANRITFYVLFIDVFERVMYGATVSRLFDLARVERQKVYFPLDAMTEIKRLTDDDLTRLPPMKRPERYANVPHYFLP